MDVRGGGWLGNNRVVRQLGGGSYLGYALLMCGGSSQAHGPRKDAQVGLTEAVRLQCVRLSDLQLCGSLWSHSPPTVHCVDCAQAYAERVARGFRPEIPRHWPEPLVELITSCWAQDPHMRPNFVAVSGVLAEVAGRGVTEGGSGLASPAGPHTRAITCTHAKLHTHALPPSPSGC